MGGVADVQSARLIPYQCAVRSPANTGRSGEQNSPGQLVDRARQRLVCCDRRGVVTNAGDAGRAASEKLGGIMAMAARKFKTLDVHSILAQGVEPFTKIRQTVDALGPDEGLSVIAPFLPSPLIEKLGSEGFQSRVERQLGGGWTVHFWRGK